MWSLNVLAEFLGGLLGVGMATLTLGGFNRKQYPDSWIPVLCPNGLMTPDDALTNCDMTGTRDLSAVLY